jgi:hypothetical protein
LQFPHNETLPIHGRWTACPNVVCARSGVAKRASFPAREQGIQQLATGNNALPQYFAWKSKLDSLRGRPEYQLPYSRQAYKYDFYRSRSYYCLAWHAKLNGKSKIGFFCSWKQIYSK